MSNARKLQTEIDRVMKKVDEGVELFDEIWEKVYSAEQQNQKEKYEMDLKKEIKKLQRLRDQIKTWIGSSDVKDKDPLVAARKLIETKMEQFKICEKETKTKAYSKEGLAKAEKLDPAEQAKVKTTEWCGEYIEKLTQLVEEADFEIEKLSSGKGKKTNKHQIEETQEHITNHRFHISKLEGIIRLVNNDRLSVEPVDAIKDDLDYYLESYEDDDYQQAYDEEFFYESLGLDELDVVNVDRVTQTASAASKKSADDAASSSSKGSRDRKSSKKNSLSSVIPMTIGRASIKKVDKSSKKKDDSTDDSSNKLTPSKAARGLASVAPATRTPAATAPPGGASMAAILKRETEQEKERQKREQQARAQAEQLRQQQLQQQLQQQQQAQREAALRQQETLRQKQQQEAAAVAQQQEQLKRQEALRQQQQQAQQQAAQQQQQQAAAAQMQAQQQAAVAAAAEQSAAQKLQLQAAAAQQQQGNTLDILAAGLGDLGLGSIGSTSSGGGAGTIGAPPGGNRSDARSPSSTSNNATAPSSDAAGPSYLSALNDSFGTVPGAVDNERSRQYTPQNPYPTPASYPSTPSAVFDNPAVFEKLGTDCLFFIFYYAQGTYQQYLAARELKKQSWRFHKKYLTWFQRHEEPKITTDEYEQGTYVYFDYETGWCTRIKTDFRFEYSFLEDSLQ